jgi:hypothetical protein
VSVRVRHAAFVKASQDGVAVTEGAVVRADFRLAPGFSIQGRVVGADGRPPASAFIDVQAVVEHATSDSEFGDWREDGPQMGEDGSFRAVGLAPGKYRLTAHSKGAVHSATVFADAGATDVVLRLEPAFVISGIVRFRDGRPVAGADVAATRTPQDPGEYQRYDAKSGDDGKFVVEDVPAGKFEVVVSAGFGGEPGKPQSNVRPLRVANVAAGDQGLVFEVEPGLTIAGRVLLPDGKPAEEGSVSAVRVEEEAPSQGSERGAAAADAWRRQFTAVAQIHKGRFELVGLDAGKYRVSSSVDGVPAASVVAEAGAADVVVQLPRGGTIKGRVILPDGKPAKEAWVTIEDEGEEDADTPSEDTDAEGKFTLTGVTPGVHRVTASFDTDDDSYEGEIKGVTVRVDATTEGVEIKLLKSE